MEKFTIVDPNGTKYSNIQGYTLYTTYFFTLAHIEPIFYTKAHNPSRVFLMRN